MSSVTGLYAASAQRNGLRRAVPAAGRVSRPDDEQQCTTLRHRVRGIVCSDAILSRSRVV